MSFGLSGLSTLKQNSRYTPLEEPEHWKVRDEILVASPDLSMQHSLRDFFERHQFKMRAAASRQDLVRELATGRAGLILLDMRLCAVDGLGLLLQIRSESEAAVIAIGESSCKAVDQIVILETGADDFVSTSLGLRELLARVRAVLRRSRTFRKPAARQGERGGFRFAGSRLERRCRRLFNTEGEHVPLTKAEYALLVAFLEGAQRPLTRQYLLQATRMHEDVFDRSVDVQVLRLRRKLRNALKTPDLIQTERGIGYTFAIAVEKY